MDIAQQALGGNCDVLQRSRRPVRLQCRLDGWHPHHTVLRCTGGGVAVGSTNGWSIIGGVGNASVASGGWSAIGSVGSRSIPGGSVEKPDAVLGSA